MIGIIQERYEILQFLFKFVLIKTFFLCTISHSSVLHYDGEALYIAKNLIKKKQKM